MYGRDIIIQQKTQENTRKGKMP